MFLASGLFENRMYCVFLGWIASLLSLKYVQMWCSCSLTNWYRSVRFFPDAKSVVSSANINTKSFVHKGKSLINNRNNSGPRIEPCGTPSIISSIELDTPLICTNCLRPDRYDLNHWRLVPLIPNLLIFFNKSVFGTVSKALRKSQNMAIACSLLLKAWVMKFWKCVMGWSVECDFRKPNWNWLIRELDSRNAVSLRHIIFSIIFEKLLSKEIGL